MSETSRKGELNAAENDPGEVVQRIQAYLGRLAERGVPESCDCAAWETFFRQYSPSLWALVRNRHWSREDSDDGNQEVWMMLVSQLPDLRL